MLGRGLLAPLGSLASAIYGKAIATRNAAFDAGRGVVHMDRPVISIGNLSVGGTGKTPMVVHVLGVLRDAGKRPCVAMRGYRAGPDGSDEAALYRRVRAGVPIVARPDRVEGLIELFATSEGEDIDTIVLDDGFQHRRLARQLDIVLLDATRSVFLDRLLPSGWLREPVSSLARAHAVVVTHAERVPARVVDEMLRRVREVSPRALLATARHEWLDLRVHHGHDVQVRPVEWLRARRVVAACAIGNPEAFIAQARDAAGKELVETIAFRDHDPFNARSIARIAKAAAKCDAIVVTEKDWSKLAKVPPETWPCAVAVPRLGMQFERGGGELTAAIVEAARALPHEHEDHTDRARHADDADLANEA
ncbi:MAG: tetraacyldisaccharide 4'-kinase [Phycisphaerae bacterium]|nr:tetraacyldisaccharide 4'-kinase [Phycisphaerae bacterium]